MIIIHSGNDFSATNFFQFDYEYKLVDGAAKKTAVVRNIKKLFNFDCNDFITLNKGDIATVIIVQKAYQCIVESSNKLTILKTLDININDTLKKLKNGR